MLDTLIKYAPILAPWAAIVVSMIAVVVSVCGYSLAKRIQNELKADEVLMAGEFHNPSLSHPDHENSVIQTIILNKSKRKAHISKVLVFDSNGAEIEVTWSDKIDQCGNPVGRSQMIGIVDSTSLCIRRNDGTAFYNARVEVSHSFDTKPMILRYEMGPGWQKYFAK